MCLVVRFFQPGIWSVSPVHLYNACSSPQIQEGASPISLWAKVSGKRWTHRHGIHSGALGLRESIWDLVVTLAFSLPSFPYTCCPQTGACWQFELLPASTTIWWPSCVACASWIFLTCSCLGWRIPPAVDLFLSALTLDPGYRWSDWTGEPAANISEYPSNLAVSTTTHLGWYMQHLTLKGHGGFLSFFQWWTSLFIFDCTGSLLLLKGFL